MSHKSDVDAIVGAGLRKLFASPEASAGQVWLDFIPTLVQERIALFTLFHGGPCDFYLADVSLQQQRAILAAIRNKVTLPLTGTLAYRYFLSGLQEVIVMEKGMEQVVDLVKTPGFDGSSVRKVQLRCPDIYFVVHHIEPFMPNVESLSISFGSLLDEQGWIDVVERFPLKELNILCEESSYRSCSLMWCFSPLGADKKLEELQKLQTRITNACPDVSKLGIACHEPQAERIIWLIKAFPSLRHLSLNLSHSGFQFPDGMINALRELESVTLNNDETSDQDVDRYDGNSLAEIAAKIGAPVVALHDVHTMKAEDVSRLRECKNLQVLDMRVGGAAVHAVPAVVGKVQELHLSAVQTYNVVAGYTVWYPSCTMMNLVKIVISAPHLRKLHLWSMRISKQCLKGILKHLGTRLVDFSVSIAYQHETPCDRLFFLLDTIAEYNFSLVDLDVTDSPDDLETDSNERESHCVRCPLVQPMFCKPLFDQACEWLLRRVPELRLVNLVSTLPHIHPGQMQ